MQGQAIFSLYILFTVGWMAVVAQCKTKRKRSQIILCFAFVASTPAMLYVVSSACVHGYYSHGNILQENDIAYGKIRRNIELMKDSTTSYEKDNIVTRNSTRMFSSSHMATAITTNATTSTKHTKAATQVENLIKEEVVLISNRKTEALLLDWIPDAYNGPSVTMKLNEYLNMSKRITPQRQRQMIEVNSMDNSWSTISFKLPLTPTVATNKFGKYMPWWEVEEMSRYKEIWYLGLGVKKNMLSTNSTNNFGFGAYIKRKEYSRKRFYNAIVGDHVAYRYKILNNLGMGSFGNVVEAFDHKEKRNVAIKFFRYDSIDGIGKKDVRELNMMWKIAKQSPRVDHFPLVYDHFIFRNHLCVIEELLGESLLAVKEVIKDKLTLQKYAMSIISPLADLHGMGISHMDLKMGNIAFVKGKSSSEDQQFLKVVDFGHSCINDSKNFPCLDVDSIQTQGYECPEVILNLPYGPACDMFDVGIILLRLATGVQQFSGENNIDSFAMMMEILGIPPRRMIELSDRKQKFVDAVCYTKKNGFKRMPYRKPLKMVIGLDLPNEFLDLISGFLRYEPSERLTATQALQHPFLTQ